MYVLVSSKGKLADFAACPKYLVYVFAMRLVVFCCLSWRGVVRCVVILLVKYHYTMPGSIYLSCCHDGVSFVPLFVIGCCLSDCKIVTVSIHLLFSRAMITFDITTDREGVRVAATPSHSRSAYWLLLLRNSSSRFTIGIYAL